MQTMVHLTESEAHFKRRLEAFSDIVFGLSLSELALQLGLPANPQALVTSPLRYFIFFGSFALVCSLWMAHHRMFATFEPRRFTVFLNFVYLAFTVLMPFGMQALMKFPQSPIGFGIYLACYGGTAASMWALLVIGSRDCGARLDEADRVRLARNVVRYAVLTAVMALSLGALPFVGRSNAAVVLFALIPTMLILRRWTNARPKPSVAKDPSL